MPRDPRTDLLLGKIALNWRYISRDLLNKALNYQRTQEPHAPLGQILVAKGVITAQQLEELLAYQARINRIKESSGRVAKESSGRLSSPQLGSPPQRHAGAHSGEQPLARSAGAESDTGFGSGGWRGISAEPVQDREVDPLLGAWIGGCRIDSKLGEGGMGAIYLAHHEALQKKVVVKVITPTASANKRSVERFFREARAAAKLEHPNVVQVHNVGTTERGLHYIVMQYVEGQNLEEKISAEGKNAPAQAIPLVLGIARGLEAAHEAQVIHRDIKAENILITHQGDAKLTDFGLAKDLNAEFKLTADGAMIGTPLYMAPEIGRVQEIDGRVDLYSLGVTFYYLLTGVQPFRGFTALEILSAKAHEKILAPEVHVPDLPEDCRRVLGKMLEKDRDARYDDMPALIKDLEALQAGGKIKAKAPTLWPPRGPIGGPPTPGVHQSLKPTLRFSPKGKTTEKMVTPKSPWVVFILGLGAVGFLALAAAAVYWLWP